MADKQRFSAINRLMIGITGSALVFALVACGSGDSKPSNEDQIKQTTQDFIKYANDADLKSVKNIICGDLEKGYAEYDDAKFKTVRDEGIKDDGGPDVISDVRNIKVNGEKGSADATLSYSGNPAKVSPESKIMMTYERRDGSWRICTFDKPEPPDPAPGLGD